MDAAHAPGTEGGILGSLREKDEAGWGYKWTRKRMILAQLMEVLQIERTVLKYVFHIVFFQVCSYKEVNLTRHE